MKLKAFFAGAGMVLLMVAAVAGVYFYEEARVSLLAEKLASAEAPIQYLKSQNDALMKEKEDLIAKAALDHQKNSQKIEDLLGKDKVLQYQNETLQSDNTQKDKKITELQDEIEKQDRKEESLMALIEEAKKQLASRPAPVEKQSTETIAAPVPPKV